MRGKATIPPVMFPVIQITILFWSLHCPALPQAGGVMAFPLPFTSFLVGKVWDREECNSGKEKRKKLCYYAVSVSSYARSSIDG